MSDLDRLSRQIQSLKLTSPLRISSHCKLTSGDKIGGYEVEEPLGKGRFSTVWLAKKPVPVAIKVYRMGSTNQRYYENEVKILNRIFEHSLDTHTSPPNLIGYLGTFAHVDIGCDLAPVIYPCIVFNLAGESVSKLLRYCKHEYERGLPLQLVKKITRDTLRALAYLHSCNIIHTDIKPSNLLMNKHIDEVDVNNLSEFEIAVGDLGGSTFTGDLFSMHVGTAQYCAPELLLEMRYGTSIDIWATFATCYELITSMLLFDVYDECAVNYGDDEIEQLETKSDPMDVVDSGLDESPHSHDCSSDVDCAAEYSDYSDSSDSSEDEEAVNYQHLLLIEKIIGPPPKEFTKNGRIYYNARGKLKNNPNVTTVSIAQLIHINCEIDPAECQRVEDFLMTGLKYNPDERITAEQTLQHP